MKAIILAGGFGTRLKHILPNTPKPMADINGKPFLAVLIDYLQKQGIEEFVLSTYYLKQQIHDYFENSAHISFAEEAEPLGTGGAILNSINKANLSGDVIIINGDTFLELDYRKFMAAHSGNFSIALREVPDTARYGRVNVQDGKVQNFTEKGVKGKGCINGGSYIINCEWLKSQNLPQKLSFETDFMIPNIAKIHANYIIADGYFIDIGIPEDYERAQNELK
ncbi:MAG: D-glycero-D-manno-heptose 1-phosphate guanosyltransferase [Alphaproteobacteria bacterium CG11_big_fil_rev_8_21_14_0_20_44_7]|nr:MAG: D-glycero-D-manno-heptose 1-phosphate guanosyltransferase [Alphaproteobacteria bacterium CG11_big_fil_rev_8_21_14_0_20_44_7]